MAVTESSRGAETRVVGYRFAGVALDLHRGRILVDGAEVATTPLLLQFLQILCASQGRLLARQELFDALWPGGQTVSDAALSQLIWRLRSLLGAHGALIATVRRGGVRLDATVEIEFGSESSPPVPPAAADAVPTEVADAAAEATPAPVLAAPASRRARPTPWRFAPVVALAVFAATGWLLFGRDRLVSDGYALYASDLQASRRDTPAITAAAFAADEAGDRERAIALMRSLHDADPTTPVPAAMLAWWRSFASPEEAAHWRAAAQARLRADTSPYLRLYVGYFLARSGPGSMRGPLSALVDLRPAAWHFQYTRAHTQIANREFAGALRSLQQMPLTIPDIPVLADVLADRVSLGDRAAAALPAQQPAIARDRVLAPYVRGRIAYSERQLADAIAAFDEAAAAAAEIGHYERQLSSSEYASVAAVELGAADALPRLAATRRLCQAQHRQDCEMAMLGFLAVLDARRGEAGRASATLAEAWQLNPHPWMRSSLLLLAFENALALPGEPAAVAADMTGEPAFAGVGELLQGWQAFARGDRDGAARELDLALERGVAQTYSAENAALLGARLGRPTPPCRVDPPYPNLLRLSACLQLLDGEKAPPGRSSGAL